LLSCTSSHTSICILTCGLNWVDCDWVSVRPQSSSEIAAAVLWIGGSPASQFIIVVIIIFRGLQFIGSHWAVNGTIRRSCFLWWLHDVEAIKSLNFFNPVQFVHFGYIWMFTLCS
jgi:hypothetical protein